MIKQLILAAAILSCLSRAAMAKPGVAFMLDAIGAVDENKAPCDIEAKSPHVTVLHIEGDKKLIEPEVQRFFQDVTPYLPGMIREALMDRGLHDQPGIVFSEATYEEGLFATEASLGVNAYVPGSDAERVLRQLNVRLRGFIRGTYRPDAEPRTESKAPATGAGAGAAASASAFQTYKLSVSPETDTHYTPHMTVTGPSVHKGTTAPVRALTVTLNQALTLRYHR